MAREPRRKREPEESEEFPGEELPTVTVSDDDRIREICASLDAEGVSGDMDKLRRITEQHDISQCVISLKRKGKEDMQYAYLTKIPLRDFDMEYIKKQYGGGAYKATIHRASGTGNLLGSFDFYIDERFKGAISQGVVSDAPALQDSSTQRFLMELARKGSQSQGPDIAGLMQAFHKSNQDMTLMMVQMQQQAIQQMATMMTSVVTAFAGNNSGGRGNDRITEILLTKALEKSDRDPIADLMRFKTFIDTGKIPDEDDEDEEDKKGSFMEMLIQAVPSVVAALSGGNRQAPAPLPAKPATEATAADAEVETGDEPEDEPDETEAMTFAQKMFLKSLIAGAENNEPVAKHAGRVKALLSDQQLEELKQVLSAPDWYERIIGVPNLKPWFESLKKEIVG